MRQPARRRMPPENGMTILFIAATDGKRAESADQARSACARLANAPSWITLPFPPPVGAAALAPRPRLLRASKSRLRAGSVLGSGLADAIGVSGVCAQVELSVRILASARLERRLALAGDVESAGIGGLHLVRLGVRLDQLRRAAGVASVLPAEPEECRGDQAGGKQDDEQERRASAAPARPRGPSSSSTASSHGSCSS